MTALAGYLAWHGTDDAGAQCARMLRAQDIYGRETAHMVVGNLALGRRLFRTLPEDRHDRGPMQAASGNLLVADVRLDNREELAAALGMDHRFMSDAAVLLAALESWGENGLDRLVGDFAFAWWQAKQRVLTLARDFAGQRPLHYHRQERFFAFASMAKGLHGLADIPRRLDLGHLGRTLAGAADTADSFFDGVRSVRPGEVVNVTPERVSTRRHWTPNVSPLILPGQASYSELLLEHLDRAVAARLRGADGAVGCHLSAGLDSGAVTTSAAEMMGSAGRIFAFTAVPRPGYDGHAPEGRIGDEGPVAGEVARRYPNIEHILVRSRDGPLGRLDRRYLLTEQPILNPSNLGWIDEIKQQCSSRGLTVLLTGELGNLSLSYSGTGLLHHLFLRRRWSELVREIAATRRNAVSRRVIAKLIFGPEIPDWLLTALQRFGLAPAGSELALVRADAVRPDGPSGGARLRRRPGRNYLDDWIDQIRSTDVGNSRKGTLAGWALDCRDPTADRRLVEFCLRVPLQLFQNRGRTRALARDALRSRLPESVTGMHRRGYQAADWHLGFREHRDEVVQVAEQAFRDPDVQRLFDAARVNGLLEGVATADLKSAAALREYRGALLRSLAVADFMRRAAGRN